MTAPARTAILLLSRRDVPDLAGPYRDLGFLWEDKGAAVVFGLIVRADDSDYQEKDSRPLIGPRPPPDASPPVVGGVSEGPGRILGAVSVVRS
jgi:hypothetical protein